MNCAFPGCEDPPEKKSPMCLYHRNVRVSTSWGEADEFDDD